MSNSFRLIDGARSVVRDINVLLETQPRRILYDDQLRHAAQSITANIREAYGRRRGPERNQFFRYARGSAEETDEHLRTNWVAQRLPSEKYWPLHNRLTVIRRMLTTLMNGAP